MEVDLVELHRAYACRSQEDTAGPAPFYDEVYAALERHRSPGRAHWVYIGPGPRPPLFAHAEALGIVQIDLVDLCPRSLQDAAARWNHSGRPPATCHTTDVTHGAAGALVRAIEALLDLPPTDWQLSVDGVERGIVDRVTVPIQQSTWPTDRPAVAYSELVATFTATPGVEAALRSVARP